MCELRRLLLYKRERARIEKTGIFLCTILHDYNGFLFAQHLLVVRLDIAHEGISIICIAEEGQFQQALSRFMSLLMQGLWRPRGPK